MSVNALTDYQQRQHRHGAGKAEGVGIVGLTESQRRELLFTAARLQKAREIITAAGGDPDPEGLRAMMAAAAFMRDIATTASADDQGQG